MSTLQERIAELAKDMPRGWKAQLAKHCGVKAPSVSDWVSGETKTLEGANLLSAAEFFGVHPTWLESGKGLKYLAGHQQTTTVNKSNIEPSAAGTVPVVSWVQAGEWCGIIDNFQPGDADEWLPCPIRHGPRTYALIVRGISMFDPTGPYSFKDGDTVFVDPDRGAGHRSLVVARLDDEHEATFKQLIIEGDQRMLQALNPSWPNRIIRVNGNCSICGVVIGKVESFI